MLYKLCVVNQQSMCFDWKEAGGIQQLVLVMKIRFRHKFIERWLIIDWLVCVYVRVCDHYLVNIYVYLSDTRNLYYPGCANRCIIFTNIYLSIKRISFQISQSDFTMSTINKPFLSYLPVSLFSNHQRSPTRAHHLTINRQRIEQHKPI